MHCLQTNAFESLYQEAKRTKVESANEPEAHQARAHHGFCIMKQLGVFTLPLEGILINCWVIPQN